MKPWNRIGLWPAIGLVIEDRQISLSVVATTPRGRKEIVRDVQPCEEGAQAAVLERLLAPWLGTRRDPRQKTASKAKKRAGRGSRSPCPSRRVYPGGRAHHQCEPLFASPGVLHGGDAGDQHAGGGAGH